MSQTYNVKFPVDIISNVISAVDRVTYKLDRDLVIASLIVYLLWLSDPSITKDPERLKIATASMSEHLAFVVDMSMKIEPKDAN